MAGAVERGLLDKAPKVLPIATSDYPTPAARPAFSVLDNPRLQCDFDLPGVDWRDSLGQVLDTLAAARGAGPAEDCCMRRSPKVVGGAPSLNAVGGRDPDLGRQPCRARVRQSVSISVVAVPYKTIRTA